MREVADITKPPSHERINICNKYVHEINNNNITKKIMKEWCIKIDNNPLNFNA